MYDELIKNLRHDSASALQNCEFDFVHAWMLEAADAIEELQGKTQVLEKLADYWCNKVPKWIPVTERLPEAGKKVLVFAYGYDTITARMCKKTEDGYPVFECKGYDGIYREMARTGRISHWMPLPQPPKDGET